MKSILVIGMGRFGLQFAERMQELGNDYRSLRNMDGLVNLVRKMEN